MTLYIKDVKDNIERHKSIEFNSLAFWRAIICELFGTLFLLFIGLSPLVNPAYEYPWNDVLSCICFSSVIFALVHIIGPVSGCNVNPIVTLALVLVRRLHPLKGLMYFVAQLTGQFNSIFLNLRGKRHRRSFLYVPSSPTPWTLCPPPPPPHTHTHTDTHTHTHTQLQITCKLHYKKYGICALGGGGGVQIICTH